MSFQERKVVERVKRIKKTFLDSTTPEGMIKDVRGIRCMMQRRTDSVSRMHRKDSLILLTTFHGNVAQPSDCGRK